MKSGAEIFNAPMVKLLIEGCQKDKSIRKYHYLFDKLELPRRKFPKMISERLITILPNGVLEYKEK